MKIDILTPDDAALKELGNRLARVRKQQRLSQDFLANEAGIGVATLRRIEAGKDSQMETWLKIMRALRMTSSIDNLLPENFASPMAEALSGAKRRRKASSKKWGDEIT